MIGVVDGSGSVEGVVVFARREDVEVAIDVEEVFGGVAFHHLSVIEDEVLDPKHLRECQPLVMDVPMNPIEIITRH